MPCQRVFLWYPLTTVGWVLIASIYELQVFLRFAINRFANIKRAHILQYGTGSSIAITGFAIWPDLTRMQLLNYAIKTRSIVYASG